MTEMRPSWTKTSDQLSPRRRLARRAPAVTELQLHGQAPAGGQPVRADPDARREHAVVGRRQDDIDLFRAHLFAPVVCQSDGGPDRPQRRVLRDIEIDLCPAGRNDAVALRLGGDVQAAGIVVGPGFTNGHVPCLRGSAYDMQQGSQ